MVSRLGCFSFRLFRFSFRLFLVFCSSVSSSSFLGRGPALRCGTRVFSPRSSLVGLALRSGHCLPGLALAAASQMGTPQEDESIFAILVAGETPNNLHQDKLGEYVR